VELFEAIRRDHRRDGLSIRALADRHGVHRRTVRQALGDAVPPVRKIPVRAAPKLDPAKALIDAMLTVDLTAPRKQRHTARRVLARLVDEHQMSDLTYSAVRDYVAKRRPEIWATAGKAVGEAFVPQTHAPGAEAEVDFADLWIDLAGVRTKCFLFTLRLSFSGKSVHRAYSTQGQEAFLEGHQQAFEVLGGTPADKIRYDNLKSAVSRVLFGRNRTESARWEPGRCSIEVDLTTTVMAHRLAMAIRALYGYPTQLQALPTPGFPAAIRHRLRMTTPADAAALARRTGLLDPRGRPRCDRRRCCRVAPDTLRCGAPSEPFM